MSGWQLSGDAPTAYTRFALKILEPWTDDLIFAAGCRDGDQVLDVACGTGLIAGRVNLVSRKLCTITGIDINDGMLNVARRTPQIEWHEGSATELPFADGSFDVVLCQQGLQYFPDRAAAMREMARVLVPGGRMALNVWGAMERQPFYVALVDASPHSLAGIPGLPSTWLFPSTRPRNSGNLPAALTYRTPMSVSNIGRCAIPYPPASLPASWVQRPSRRSSWRYRWIANGHLSTMWSSGSRDTWTMQGWRFRWRTTF